MGTTDCVLQLATVLLEVRNMQDRADAKVQPTLKTCEDALMSAIARLSKVAHFGHNLAENGDENGRQHFV